MDLTSYLLHPRDEFDKISKKIPMSFVEEVIEVEPLDEFTAQLPEDLPLVLERAGHGLHFVVIKVGEKTYKLLLSGARIANISLFHGGEEVSGLRAFEKLFKEQGPTLIYVYRVHPPTAKAIKSLMSGYEPMDKIHEEMISLANNLIVETIIGRLGEARKAVEKLYRHTVDKHFPFEENLMKQHQYPNMDEHLRYHQLYREALEQIRILADKERFVDTIYELLATFDSYLKYLGDEDRRLTRYIEMVKTMT